MQFALHIYYEGGRARHSGSDQKLHKRVVDPTVKLEAVVLHRAYDSKSKFICELEAGLVALANASYKCEKRGRDGGTS